MKRGNKAQIAIEFLLLVSLSFFVLFFLIAMISTVNQSQTNQRTFDEITDFARSIQLEFLLASEMEVGYHRFLELPERFNGKEYQVALIPVADYQSAIIFEFEGAEVFYMLPRIQGEIVKGEFAIVKKDEGLFIQ